MVTCLLLPLSSSLSPYGEALLDLKRSFNDTTGSLRCWRPADSNPCSWTGVSCHLPDLRIRSINLPYMQLGGILSPSIGKLSRLQRLALHRNRLHGMIPAEIGNCRELRALYLRANFLQGSIPREIGDFTNLTILNLSINFFSGEIPNVGVFGKFRNTSFVGNLELCGLPIQKLCRGSLGYPAVLPHSEILSIPDIPPVPTRRKSHFFDVLLISAMSTMGLALVVLFGFLWACLLSRKGRLGEKYIKVDRHAHDGSTKLVTFQGDMPYSSREIIEKLELLDEEDVDGSGGFGTVYKMVMDDCSAFAVKRIDWNREGSDQIFERELEILGSIKHINLVNLRGYCKLPSAKLLIYDYVALGSLDDYLHEHGQELQPLNWNARMKIAIGSAQGLAYLHHDCSPVVVHRDIKSSNILLDQSLEPRVSDFGLAKLLVDNDAHVTVVAGTFGYFSPASPGDE